MTDTTKMVDSYFYYIDHEENVLVFDLSCGCEF